jgi:hypothetical protein
LNQTSPFVIPSETATSRNEAAAQSRACPEPVEGDLVSVGTMHRRRREFSCRSSFSRSTTACKQALPQSVLIIAATLLLATLASAQTLTGTVKNGTTGKPSAGDEVVLLKLSQGMEEAGRTKTDGNGKFSFKLDDAQAPHLVRAIHEDVTYHRMAPPGTTSVELEVYDAAKKVDGLEVVADILRLEAQQGKLVVVREFGVQNSSKPPRTQMNEHNLEFNIPEGAQVIPDSATATTEGGNPLRSAPVPEDDKKLKYAFIFPLRPGLTRFEVAYQMSYTGSANLDPKSIYPLQHFVVMLPKSMQFTAAPATGYKLIDYPSEPNAAVQVASNTTPGESLAFKVSGEGVLEQPQQDGQTQSGGNSGGGAGNAEASNNRPGGGLGPPIDAPDPLQKYRWWILGGFAAILVVGGVIVASRQQSAARAVRARVGAGALQPLEQPYDAAEPMPVTSAAPRPASALLGALKEELFQLEVERRQGQISKEEYEKAKSALDQTLDRALKREAQKA